MDNRLQLQWLRYYVSNLTPASYFVKDLIMSVIEAGEEIRSANRSAEIKAGDGHRSIVTIADEMSNKYILSTLENYTNARFLCEEGSDDRRVLSRDLPDGIFGSIHAAVIDSLDGTSRFAGKFPDWCVAAGALSMGKIYASVITAPDANGGTICFSHNHTTLLSEGLSMPELVPELSCMGPKQAVILRGVDTELYANMVSIMPRIAASVRAIYTEGSGLFGLMSVALGRAAAIIQTPQKAWDWVPAYHALTSVGGVFRFFRLNDGNLIPVETYDFEAFIYKKENRLGFVAGEPDMADRLFNLLPKTGWERHDPDTI